MANSKRYIIDYCSPTTGFGWRRETNSRKEAEKVARYISETITNGVSVWDCKVDDFIFDKCTLEYKPRIDRF